MRRLSFSRLAAPCRPTRLHLARPVTGTTCPMIEATDPRGTRSSGMSRSWLIGCSSSSAEWSLRQFLVVGAIAMSVRGGATVAAAPTATAHRATGTIYLDGRLSEPDWDAAPLIGPLTQREPNEGQPPTETTDVRILFDDD